MSLQEPTIGTLSVRNLIAWDGLTENERSDVAERLEVHERALGWLDRSRNIDPRVDKNRIEERNCGLGVDLYHSVLSDAGFQRWRDDEHIQLLWVKGSPGRGRDMLLCNIIDNLKESITDTDLLSFFFCQAKDSRANSATAVLRGLIYLLASEQPSVIPHIQEEYKRAGNQPFHDRNPWGAVSQILASILDNLDLQNTFLVVDALEECVTDLPLLLDFIVSKSSASSRVKWIVSSRNSSNVEQKPGFDQSQWLSLDLELTVKGFETISAQPRTASSPKNLVPFHRDPNFVNRGGITNRITFELARLESRQPNGMTLLGPSGVGKSHLAIEFAYRVSDERPDVWVFWVHAQTRARVEEGFRTIADAVGLSDRYDPEADIPELVCTWLADEKNGQWIIILDGANDLEVFYGTDDPCEERPSPTSRLIEGRYGIVIITTRNRDLAVRLEDKMSIEIGPMLQAEAVTLLKRRLPLGADAGAAGLLQKLGLIPLFISHATAYMRARALPNPVEQYLDVLRDVDCTSVPEFRSSLHDRILAMEAPSHEDVYRHLEVLSITWQVSFGYTQSTRPSAAKLLSLMSYFGQGIPLALLKPAEGTTDLAQLGSSDKVEDSEPDSSHKEVDGVFDKDIMMLMDLGFVTSNKDGDMFEMHEYVQSSARSWLESHGLEVAYQRVCVTRVAAAFPKTVKDDSSTWPTCERLFPHVEVALDYLPRHIELQSDRGWLKEWATLLFNGGMYAWLRGRDNVAERMTRASNMLHEQYFGKSDKASLACISLLAQILAGKGLHKDAEKLFVQVIETHRMKHGSKHAFTLASMAVLASIYESQGRLDEAGKLYRDVTELRELVLGKRHPDTLASMASLASIYESQGRLDEAGKLYRDVTELRELVLGKRHPDTLVSMASLASIYESQGCLDEAGKLRGDVRKLVLGKRHSDTLASIAIWRLEIRQVMEMEKMFLRDKDPDTTRRYMDSVPTVRGGYWKMRRSLERCFQPEREISNHPHTKGIRSNQHGYTTHMDNSDGTTTTTASGSLFSNESISTNTSVSYQAALDRERVIEDWNPTTFFDHKRFPAGHKPDKRDSTRSIFPLPNEIESLSESNSELLDEPSMEPDVLNLENATKVDMDRSQGEQSPAQPDTGYPEDIEEAVTSAQVSLQPREEMMRTPHYPWIASVWYWLTAVLDPPPTGVYRATYTCGCGKLCYIDVEELVSGGAVELEQEIRTDAALVRRHTASGGATSTSGDLQSPSQVHLASSSPSRNSGQGAPIHNLPLLDAQAPGTSSTPAAPQRPADTGANPAQKYLLLCVNTKHGLVKPVHIDVSNLTNDQFLFQSIRIEYGRTRQGHDWNLAMLIPQRINIPAWILNLLSITPPWHLELPKFMAAILQNSRMFIPHKIEFVKFELMPVRLEICVGNIEKPEIPGADEVQVKKAYEYKPINQKAKILSVPIHQLLEPGPHLNKYWWNRFPKKLDDPLVFNEDLDCQGWGILITEGWNRPLVFLISLFLMAAFAMFVVVYSVLTKDGSTGSGIGSFMVATLALYCTLRYERWKSE